MDKAEALSYIADGHAVYSIDEAKEILSSIGLNGEEANRLAFKGVSDRGPGNPKGLQMAEGAEGEMVVAALSIGDFACRHYKLEPQSFYGRGKQGQEYAYRLKTYFWAEEAKS